MRISQLSSVYVNANVPDEDLAYVRPGTVVTFTTSSVANRRFTGRISDVNPTPTQGTLSYRARIVEPNPDLALRGGMLVTLTVQKERHAGATVVPRSAVFQTENGANVFTVVDGKAREVPVTVGLQTDTLSEVRGGSVKPGTTVIVTRPDALQNGSVVAIANGPNAGGAQSSGAAGTRGTSDTSGNRQGTGSGSSQSAGGTTNAAGGGGTAGGGGAAGGGAAGR
jgi:RND family efflux transporter MFP subunit